MNAFIAQTVRKDYNIIIIKGIPTIKKKSTLYFRNRLKIVRAIEDRVRYPPVYYNRSAHATNYNKYTGVTINMIMYAVYMPYCI